MNGMILKVKNKVEEYGIHIFKHHEAEQKQYAFFCERMVIFVMPDDSISVAFQATTQPDEAANLTLILNEIPNIDMTIMESFIYDPNKKLICGEKAYELINDSIRQEGAQECIREATYAALLQSNNCHEC